MEETQMRLPAGLIKAFQERRAAVFVGAGASVAAGLMSWDDLVNDLAKDLDFPLPQQPISPELLLKIPQYYFNRKGGRRELIRFIKDDFKRKEQLFRKNRRTLTRPIHHYLAKLPTDLYYTTNLDTYLEDELRNERRGVDVIDSEKKARQHSERERCQVRKIHGSIDGDSDDVVLTSSDFANIERTRPFLFNRLADDLTSHIFLFVGYSLRDPDFGSLYNNVFTGMQGKHQSHFLALVEDPGVFENEDLRRRGLVPIEVWRYPGANSTEKITRFLTSLVAATSDQFHIERFYKFSREDDIPIVITSRLHDTEKYVYYPACDIEVAHQVSADLHKIGVTARIFPDEYAINNTERLLSDHLILVCSPFGNRFTKYVLAAGAGKEPPILECFTEAPGGRRIISTRGQEFQSDLPSENAGGEATEYSIIARYQSRWAKGKYIFVFAGLQALGTYAAAAFVKDSEGYRWLSEANGTGDIVAILPIKYSSYNPYMPQYELGKPIRIAP
jgi:hypothetical protein